MIEEEQMDMSCIKTQDDVFVRTDRIQSVWKNCECSNFYEIRFSVIGDGEGDKGYVYKEFHCNDFDYEKHDFNRESIEKMKIEIEKCLSDFIKLLGWVII